MKFVEARNLRWTIMAKRYMGPLGDARPDIASPVRFSDANTPLLNPLAPNPLPSLEIA